VLLLNCKFSVSNSFSFGGHSHTIVPQNYQVLGWWVNTQRKQYKKLKSGKKSSLTAERALKLAELGFCFDASGKKGGGGSSNASGLGAGQAHQQQLNHATHLNASYQITTGGPIDPTGDTDALLNANHPVMASTQFMGSVGVDFGNLT
jgi:hypothetical protein